MALIREARAETEARRRRMPISALERIAGTLPAAQDFAAALSAPGLSVIAEMKARTPLMGVLAERYSPAGLARTYAGAGAAALSVLAQETSFGGRPEHLAEARAASALPVLRKDFVTDEYQVVEARAFGADAVLLIVAALGSDRLRELLAAVRRLGMEALVEVHDASEVEAALSAGARVVGVNHRDLRTFAVDTGLTAELRSMVPSPCLLVAESGIADAGDARRLRRAGADAVLVGEALMRSPDPATKIRELSVP
ncbi:MAG: indole-3-glycerol phosphate synthase TrpC [Candidatus Dormibacteraceae bacterium]